MSYTEKLVHTFIISAGVGLAGGLITGQSLILLIMRSW